MTLDKLLAEVEQLSSSDKWRLVNHVLRALEQEQHASSTDWKTALKATYGILADDPIERPPQLPLEEREPLESLNDVRYSVGT